MDDETITRGTGNVFADLGYADAEERQTKLQLARAINGLVARRRLTQAVPAEKLGVRQPKVSAPANDKLDGFSVERLTTFLTAFDQDAEIVIRNKPRSRTAGRIFCCRGINLLRDIAQTKQSKLSGVKISLVTQEVQPSTKGDRPSANAVRSPFTSASGS